MRRLSYAILICLCGPPASLAEEPPAKISAEQEKFFETKIRPVLVQSCYECHSAKKQQFGLRVDSRKFLVDGGDGGSALTPGKLEESRLWQVLQHDPDDTQMPPDSKLPDDVLANIKAWIEMGAPWPASEIPAEAADDVHSNWRDHWAYQPIQRPAVPTPENDAWSLTEIDRFIAAKLAAAGLAPSPPADKESQLRRLKYDLLGLPAEYEEVQRFVNNNSPTAYDELVDEYLASPQFGERWARHWLDVSRYADTKGYVFREDRNYPDAWRYREWVIGALNKDLPYNEFVIKQIAADLVSDDPADLHAMGFLTLGRRFLNNRHDIIDDRIDVVTRGLMGLTVTCARCHDHKFDPIPAADYYSLYGVFNSCDEPKNEPSTLRLVDKEKPADPVIFLRGKPGNNGPKVPRQFLQVVHREERQPFQKGSGRLEMAQAIVAADNPLTARVWANRVWGHLIGNGLVRTPSDFGVRADSPTHPELLDYLAGTLIDNGWSTKQLIRAIVKSQAYRQQSDATLEIIANDPENELLTHMNRRRRDFEGLRDAVLAASGELDPTVGGQSVKITEQPFPKRRTVYAFVDRQNLPGLFRAFDFAGPDTHSPKRYETDVPQQALFLMNSPFVLEQATQLVESIALDDPAEKVRRIYQQVLARQPTDSEIELAVRYVTGAVADDDPVQPNPWSYGYGDLDPEAGKLKAFTPLPHFTGKAWQGGAKLPDDTLSWTMLNPKGGHPGKNLQQVTVRRWTAPADGRISVRGKLKHSKKEGDGVRGRILVAGVQQGEAWHVHNAEQKTPLKDIPVKAGETVEFVTDLWETLSHDGFEWPVTITLQPMTDDSTVKYSAETQFAGPPPSPLTAWAQFAQILLLSNEFQFVD